VIVIVHAPLDAVVAVRAQLFDDLGTGQFGEHCGLYTELHCPVRLSSPSNAFASFKPKPDLDPPGRTLHNARHTQSVAHP